MTSVKKKRLTTIKISKPTRKAIKNHKRGGESYDKLLRRTFSNGEKKRK